MLLEKWSKEMNPWDIFASSGETYEFLAFSTDSSEGGNCTTWSGCDGVYSEDTNTLRQAPSCGLSWLFFCLSAVRQVGYCQRINHYPKIYVTASDRTVNIGTTYVEGGAVSHMHIGCKSWRPKLHLLENRCSQLISNVCRVGLVQSLFFQEPWVARTMRIHILLILWRQRPLTSTSLESTSSCTPVRRLPCCYCERCWLSCEMMFDGFWKGHQN